jgi:branched-chain amino acid aminotransferase
MVEPGQRLLWRDGALCAWESATISSLAHPMQRGALVFDVLSFHEGRGPTAGVAVFRLREHVERFLRSLALIGMRSPFDAERLCAATCEAVACTGLRDGLIRISGFVPTLEADLVPRSNDVSVVIAAYARTDMPKRHAAPPCLAIHVPKDVRKAAPDAIPPLAKVAAAYLGPMIARGRALDAGFDEVVLLDRDGHVAEAPTANFFAVYDGALVTPPLGNILDGITRDSILELAREEGIEVQERALGYDELLRADEAFITATSYLVAPIASIDRRPLRLAAPGPLSARLKARFHRVLAGDDPRASAWLARV